MECGGSKHVQFFVDQLAKECWRAEMEGSNFF